jgi:hypothetical protein
MHKRIGSIAVVKLTPLDCTFSVFNLATATKCWRERFAQHGKSLPISWLADFGCGSLALCSIHLGAALSNTSVGARGEKLNGKQQNNAVCLVFTFLARFCRREWFLRISTTTALVSFYAATRRKLSTERVAGGERETPSSAAPVQIPLVAFNDSPRKLEAGHKPKGSERARR